MDIFYKKLKTDIEKFYDDPYQEESLRQVHLSLLHENYSHSRFAKCENLEVERVKFLTELQELVDKHSEWYS